MNANRKLVIDFRINGKHDHFINRKQDRHVQPHMPLDLATQPKSKKHPGMSLKKKGDK